MSINVFKNARDLIISDLKPMKNVILKGIKRMEKNKLLEKLEDQKGNTYETVNTNLISKEFSPMIVRKYNIINGWPVYVGVICDYSLTDLDKVVNVAVDSFSGRNLNDIQEARNLAGTISESIKDYYNEKKKNCVEGIGIGMYVDKCFISSLYGDFMNHLSCRLEFYQILNILPHI